MRSRASAAWRVCASLCSLAGSAPDNAIVERLVTAAKALLGATPRDHVTGRDVACEAGLDPHDPAVYLAFVEIDRHGTLKLDTWGGAPELPAAVSLP